MKQIVHLLLVFITLPLIAQENNASTSAALIKQAQKADYSNRSIAERDFFNVLSTEFGLSQCTFQKKTTPKSKTQYSYTRYQQFYKGLEVIEGQYILHSKNGIVKRGRGKIIPHLNTNIIPTISLGQIQEVAEGKLNIDLLSISPEQSGNLPVWNRTSERFVIIGENFPKFSTRYKLAYELILESNHPYNFNETVYIDAHSGAYINHFTNVHSAPIETDVQTLQYGKQTITVEEVNSSYYEMKDEDRGIEIRDSDNGNLIVSNIDSNFDSDNEAIPWAAADAHYCTEKYHDFMVDHFEWKGVDGIGGTLKTRVNQGGKYYVNATWNGTYASFGNGDCDSYFPLTTLDVVGHEYAHGFVDFTSDLVYQDQSGALNESTADIMGKSLEYIYDPENFTWNLAQKAARNETITGFRSMADPHLKADPKGYGDSFWYTGAGDRGGVHTNSGVMNYWYYLLVEGGSGTNELGYEYNVASIGLEDALQVLYHAHLASLTLDSDYFDAMNGTILAAGDLFGIGSVQQINVIEAWMAANLFPGMNDIDLSIEPILDNISLCLGEVKNAEVIIRNVGNNPLLAGTIVNLDYDLPSSAHSEQIDLMVDLNPGDSILYTLQEDISGNFASSHFMDVDLSTDNDLNSVNNRTTIRISGSEVEGTDIRLTNFSFTQSGECGIPTLTRYSYTIQNLGCQSLYVGDSIYIHVDTGSELYMFRRALFFDFEPGNYQGASINLPEDIVGDFKNYTAWVEFKDYTDIRPENDSQEGEIAFLDLITKGYFEDFSPEVDDNLFYIYSSTYRGVDTIYNYKGNDVLAFTGQRRTGNFDACEELEDFYDEYNYVSYIRYCADATGMDRPFFSFDLTQLRNSEFSQEIENDYYQCIVRVVTDSTSYDYIYGLEEGVSHYFEYELPQDYIGKIEIQAITLTGYEFAFENEEYEGLFDAALIDNIHFFDKTEEEEKFKDSDFIVFPNPASDYLTVQSKERDRSYDIHIYDQLGRRIKEVENQQFESEVDLSSLASAVYFLTIIEDGLEVKQQKIVIAH